MLSSLSSSRTVARRRGPGWFGWGIPRRPMTAAPWLLRREASDARGLLDGLSSSPAVVRRPAAEPQLSRIVGCVCLRVVSGSTSLFLGRPRFLSWLDAFGGRTRLRSGFGACVYVLVLAARERRAVSEGRHHLD